jgi:hypothetical protein
MKYLKSIQLHSTALAFIPGLGNLSQLKPTLDSNGYPGLEMTLNNEATLVMCEFRGVTFAIPVTSLKGLIFAEPPVRQELKTAAKK